MLRRWVCALAILLVAAAPARAAWQDETIYFIFTDRFNASEGWRSRDPRGWHGGDLRGIIEKLDYIKELGFTAIWLTPHVKNSPGGYHGYHAIDFFEVDPRYGDLETLKELVAEAHRRDLKVLFDIVVNHTGPDAPLLKEKPEWFHPKRSISNWNDPVQLTEGWIFDLPDLNQDLPEVREYILAYSRYWIEQTGVDGFRLDTVKHVPAEFWQWYSAELKKIKPDFWLLGEAWVDSPYSLVAYQGLGIDALIDFPLHVAITEVFGKDAPMGRLAQTAAVVEKLFDDPFALGGFIDNHDVTRFMTAARQDDPVGRLQLALIYLFTQRSLPIVYYGTEVGMAGENDPYNRADFPWGEEPHPEVRELVRKLNGVRAARPALRRGSMESLLNRRDAWAFARVVGDDLAIVVLNNHGTEGFAEPVPVAQLGLAEGTVLVDALSGAQITVVEGEIVPSLEARSGAIYVPAPPGGVGSPWLLAGAAAAAVLLTGLIAWRQRQ